ncbi:related to C6 finger domain protein [Cephalotrichum gorgonifer]|uniref:Related to C6 finger domain protein n=1 Tax=Cephalotrichum gorgonifer TaxID=2041049 RepID=A0AAE8SXM8_9PEZI|nr:related to C6 finger domain protein [Cephalotrichum gorgonifer]
MTLNFNSAGIDPLTEFTFNQRERYSYQTPSDNRPPSQSSAMGGHPIPSQQRSTWPMPIDLSSTGTSPTSSNPSDDQHQYHQQQHHHQHQTPSPVQSSSSPHSQHSEPSPFLPATSPLTDWALQQQQQQQQLSPHDLGQFFPDSAAMMGLGPMQANYQQQPSPLDYLPATTQAALNAGIPLESPFGGLPSVGEAHPIQWSGLGVDNWHDFQTTLPIDGLASIGSNSPTGTYLEVLSLPSSSGGDGGWSMVDFTSNFGQAQSAAIFNPSQTLHLRTNSDSSDGANSMEFGSFEEVPRFPPYSPFSTGSDTYVDTTSHRNCFPHEMHVAHHTQDLVSPAVAVAPVPIKSSPSSSIRSSPSSGSGSTSPPSTTVRRNSGPRKSPIAKTTSAKVIRRSSTGRKDGNVEKKVGRRRGPLLPEQRKQASEIRKLRACLRCKFLKKTCDKGEPCAGCQPSHARLWQVPCTRIDIKDIGYFMKDWKADYDRHLVRGVSVYNVKGFAQKESLMWITHGYGFALAIPVREVYVADESCFQLDWVESCQPDVPDPIDFEIRTERLDVGVEGISVEALSEYLDKHIDGPFEEFINDHFEGTPFITEILATAHRYYMKEKSPVIRKALKLVLAYNLTLHITLVENQGSEVQLDGQIDDEDSKFYGRVVAPVMVNFQIKCALADMWRELQKDILEELSALYSSVYSGERLKNWPTIFMLASILLAVWEEMQFDCHYRVPDPVAVDKFCNDMESTPVGVIIGLFHAISQKVPAFTDWDTEKHGHILKNNVAVCEAMTEVRQHVTKHEAYLRTRPDTKFDSNDFDSLSNKFLSKLVIRAN